MPEHDEPQWPSDDEDTGSEGGGKTAELPVSGFSMFEPQTVWVTKPQSQPPRRPAAPPPPDHRPPAAARQPVDQVQPVRRTPPPPQHQPEQQWPRQEPEQQPDPQYQQWPPQQSPPQQQPPQQQQPQQQPSQPQPPRPSHLGAPQPPMLPPVPAAPHAMPMRIEPTGELHPAEATTGADRPAPAAESAPAPAAVPKQPKQPKRKKRGLLIGGLALLLVIAVGVALALPYVSNRLGLPWAPNAPKGAVPQPVAVTRVLHGPSASAPAPTADGVAAALTGPAGNSLLATLTGSVLDPATGDVLWDRGSGQPLTPASTTKVLTVAAALLAMDPRTQFSTKVVQGAEPGTVVLVGGGDPTLSSLPEGKESLYPGAAHLDDLVAQVKASGVPVSKVQLDLSAYTGERTAPGWAPDDAPSTFMAPVTAAMLDGGRSDPNDDKSMRTGDPSGVLAQKFAERLGATAQPNRARAPGDAKVLAEVKSAPLTELTTGLLDISDNLLADAVARQTAIATGGEASFAGGAKATLDVLAQNGFDVTGAQLFDNSGLSTMNKVPAGVLSALLAVAAAPEGKDPRTAKLRPLLEGLPVAGGSGTLSGRYTDGAGAKGKGWVRAKTGTLDGANTLAGIVLDTDGRPLVFALMSSSTQDKDAVRKGLDAIAATLRGCGCR
ncbi:D-alanyl-D-alanine carboxypeptidase/D-alanyl-D-alanine endopeptidase [Amycolatopsis nigrescens]|uniref:D-alanyl-D-alanine carboxypeptidase/D-alanyl-D-alanine endopeptidase n=1 Tax=Amycolatopsis nigrescens TaxID=381445 RepID=UPI000376DEA8|nr:D-alanyl-D-alanine carboxypeptidase/D-alanyl-D-alanine-endopeptidase [Amycolatopsis nigrescens]